MGLRLAHESMGRLSEWKAVSVRAYGQSEVLAHVCPFIVLFPLTFVSSAFVPAAGLPGVLQDFAAWNPISALAAAVRTLFGNPTAMPPHGAWPLEHPILAALAWTLAILAVAAPAAARTYRVRTAG